MADFQTALACVLKNEDPEGTGRTETDSNGAAVRYGINRAYHAGIDPTFYDGSMPNEQALAIAAATYRSDYWDAVCGDAIEDQSLANHLLDMAVNAGTGGAVLALQAVVNGLGRTVALSLDAQMGPETVRAANAATGIVATYRAARTGYYIAESLGPGKASWRNSWLARLNVCG